MAGLKSLWHVDAADLTVGVDGGGGRESARALSRSLRRSAGVIAEIWSIKSPAVRAPRAIA
jgi:hypothetical protein